MHERFDHFLFLPDHGFDLVAEKLARRSAVTKPAGQVFPGGIQKKSSSS